MTKIMATITVEDDKGEVTEYKAYLSEFDKVEFGGVPEFSLEPPKLDIGAYFKCVGTIIDKQQK